jgi:hypothetical protein
MNAFARTLSRPKTLDVPARARVIRYASNSAARKAGAWAVAKYRRVFEKLAK